MRARGLFALAFAMAALACWGRYAKGEPIFFPNWVIYGNDSQSSVCDTDSDGNGVYHCVKYFPADDCVPSSPPHGCDCQPPMPERIAYNCVGGQGSACNWNSENSR